MTLKELWRRWTEIAKVVGEFQSRLLLTLFYFLIMGPIALCLKLLADPLRLKTPSRVSWSPMEERTQRNIDGAGKQF